MPSKGERTWHATYAVVLLIFMALLLTIPAMVRDRDAMTYVLLTGTLLSLGGFWAVAAVNISEVRRHYRGELKNAQNTHVAFLMEFVMRMASSNDWTRYVRWVATNPENEKVTGRFWEWFHLLRVLLEQLQQLGATGNLLQARGLLEDQLDTLAATAFADRKTSAETRAAWESLKMKVMEKLPKPPFRGWPSVL